MDRFKELIDKGVAPFHSEPIANPLPETDRIVRYWNNDWGFISNTHMSTYKDGYLVTGSLCNRKSGFSNLIFTPTWETHNFPQPFYQVMYQQGLVGKYVIINGQQAFYMFPRPEGTFGGAILNDGDAQVYAIPAEDTPVGHDDAAANGEYHSDAGNTDSGTDDGTDDTTGK